MGPISRYLAVVAPLATLSCVEQQWVARIPAIIHFFSLFTCTRKRCCNTIWNLYCNECIYQCLNLTTNYDDYYGHMTAIKQQLVFAVDQLKLQGVP